MTNSGLIVFLPLVGAILGGIVGAVGGAWANSWYRDREAKKAEDQERKGLLSLINAEVVEHWITFFVKPPPAAIAAQLSTDNWDRSKTRLAQLLPANDIFVLVSYYSQINLIRNQCRSLADAEDTEGVEDFISKAEAQTNEVLKVTSNYVDDPMSFGHMVQDDRQTEGAADDNPT
jgi:hypothetical protein